MQVAHTMMMEGDLKAMDRVIRLAGELDRYHGYGRAEIAAAPAPAPPARIGPPAPRAAVGQAGARDRRSGNFPPRKALKQLETRQETRRRAPPRLQARLRSP